MPIRSGDRLLLCSDGLSSVVTDEELLEMLARPLNPDATARCLVNAANDAGGPDNITAVIVDIHKEARLPNYTLPPRREDGPIYVDVLLSTQRGNSLVTYVMLMIAYFALLGIILFPARSALIGMLGTALLVGILVTQRVQVARRARAYLEKPSAVLQDVMARIATPSQHPTPMETNPRDTQP